MNYYEYHITTPQYSAEKNELIMALLGDLPFESFEEKEDVLIAYISESNSTQDIDNQLVELGKDFDFIFNKKHIPYQNWNVIWESNFQPIRVADFVGVRADFHPPTEGVQFDLVINPKMAFGTGHHETTYMMMDMMRDLDFENKSVLDYGCGTGILAILASKLRANPIEAVDIEEASYENTIENSTINNVSNIKTFCGTLDAINSKDFDIILANINRNVILDSLASLKNMLKNTQNTEGPEGYILISGFLREDALIMSEAILNQNFNIIKTKQRGNWLCMLLQNA
jgi:ribosomal protein L11 methyltransferase